MHTRWCAELASAVLDSPDLSNCISREVDAGCGVEPSFASGAKLLVPLTAYLLGELGLQLEVHHIVALRPSPQQVARAGKGIYTILFMSFGWAEPVWMT